MTRRDGSPSPSSSQTLSMFGCSKTVKISVTVIVVTENFNRFFTEMGRPKQNRDPSRYVKTSFRSALPTSHERGIDDTRPVSPSFLSLVSTHEGCGISKWCSSCLGDFTSSSFNSWDEAVTPPTHFLYYPYFPFILVIVVGSGRGNFEIWNLKCGVRSGHLESFGDWSYCFGSGLVAIQGFRENDTVDASFST